jgi:hypothetical protein
MPEIKTFRDQIKKMIDSAYNHLDYAKSDPIFEMYNDAVIKHLEALRSEFARIDEMAEFI